MSPIERIGLVVFVLGVVAAIISWRHQAWASAFVVAALVGVLPFVFNTAARLAAAAFPGT